MTDVTFYAIATKNDPLVPANAGWQIQVFDHQDQPVGDPHLALDSAYLPGSIEDRIALNMPLGFTASPRDVSREGVTYRVRNVRQAN
ncbi:hypothetical protein ITJ38_17505 [Agreia pratensis]|uniref:hypothetical protein n=1 Tax=Agreia pratensis TaxID=150121 RepID=UPI00188A58B0|nr:hypothetical protein [Agreia pratensis]MBF4636210.1 hypothetical protein [Agreia pratensis]